MALERNRELLEWVDMLTTESLPSGAVPGGYTEEGETTYVARSKINPGTYSSDGACGAYIPSLKVASIPYAGGDALCKNCEVLVCRDFGILFWTDAANGSIPDLAVGIGNEGTEEIYVSRTHSNSKLNGLKTADGTKMKINKAFKGPMLGKLHPSHGTMYLAYKKLEYFVPEYEVLCAYCPPAVRHSIPSPHTWTPGSNGYVPEGAFTGGMTNSDECTYVARVSHGTDYPIQVGFVVPSENVCRYSWQGIAYSSDDYEVMVPLNSKDFSWKLSSYADYSDNENAVRVDSNVHACAIGRTKSGPTGVGSGRTWMGEGFLDEIGTNRINEKMQIVGSIHHNSRCLYVPYKGKDFMFDSYEILVVSPVPNTLMELCRYAILSYYSAVPERINALPLSPKMAMFCQLRKGGL